MALYSPNVRICTVSFTDVQGVTHAVEVSASSLYEAAALAVAEFRRCDFMDRAPGQASKLTVAVKAPATTHEIGMGKLTTWLEGSGKSPREQVLKQRLRQALGV